MSGTDARLVPAAALAWAACLAVTAAPAVAWAVLAGATAVAVGVAGWGWGPARGRWPPWCGTVVVLATAVAAVTGSVVVTEHVRRAGPLAELVGRGAVVDLTGQVATEPAPIAGRWGTERWRAVLTVASVAGRGGGGTAAAEVVLLAGPELARFAVGSDLAVTARLTPAAAPDRPVALAFAVGPPTPRAPPGPVDRAVERVRSALLAVTEPLPPDARGLVPGLAVGDTSRLPGDLAEAMRVTGLTHITAVSGGHFAVLFLAVVGATIRLPRPVRAAVTVLVMGAFVLVVRPDPPVLRAATMGLITVIGTLLRRRARAIPALAVTVLVLLTLDPWVSRSLGFTLSVAATSAIVLVAPALTRAWADHAPHLLAQAVAVPVAAQVACAPLLVPLDSGVGLYAVPANLLAAPALVPGTLAGVAAAALATVAPVPAHWLTWVAAGPAWWIAAVARTFADLPGARVPVPDGAGGVVLVAVGGAGAVAALLLAPRIAHRLALARAGGAARGGPALWALAAGVVALAVAVVPVAARAPGEWTVAMCDVGQGDMLVLRSGPRAAVVVDVGPEPGAADACLRELGVAVIDLLVLTHHHADHVGGLEGAVRGRPVVAAVLPPLAEPPAAAREVALILAGVPAAIGTCGLAGTAGQVRWQVLGPRRAGPDVNDASVLVHLEVAGVTVLALGDVSAGPQDELAADLVTAGLQVDVLKMAHHGARDQSRALAEATRPAVVLIGVGENDYGHPTGEAIELYHGVGALVLGTDRCTTVLLSVRGEALASSCGRRRAPSADRDRLGPCHRPPGSPPPGRPSPPRP